MPDLLRTFVTSARTAGELSGHTFFVLVTIARLRCTGEPWDSRCASCSESAFRGAYPKLIDAHCPNIKNAKILRDDNVVMNLSNLEGLIIGYVNPILAIVERFHKSLRFLDTFDGVILQFGEYPLTNVKALRMVVHDLLYGMPSGFLGGMPNLALLSISVYPNDLGKNNRINELLSDPLPILHLDVCVINGEGEQPSDDLFLPINQGLLNLHAREWLCTIFFFCQTTFPRSRA